MNVVVYMTYTAWDEVQVCMFYVYKSTHFYPIVIKYKLLMLLKMVIQNMKESTFSWFGHIFTGFERMNK